MKFKILTHTKKTHCQNFPFANFVVILLICLHSIDITVLFLSDRFIVLIMDELGININAIIFHSFDYYACEYILWSVEKSFYTRRRNEKKKHLPFAKIKIKIYIFKNDHTNQKSRKVMHLNNHNTNKLDSDFFDRI